MNYGSGLRDGYEADTDTMPKRRGSVKQMAARSFLDPLIWEDIHLENVSSRALA